ncbi:MAG: SDR family oxidoreductase [Acidimicrobiales bacterium]
MLEAAAAHGGPHVAYLNAGVTAGGTPSRSYRSTCTSAPWTRTCPASCSGCGRWCRRCGHSAAGRSWRRRRWRASWPSRRTRCTMTKYAVTGFVQAMAPRLTVDGITIDAVCPSVVDTPMTTEALKGGSAADLGIPMISPTRIAETALRLATTDGTGRCVAIIDGVADIEWRFPDFVDLLKAAPQPDA